MKVYQLKIPENLPIKDATRLAIIGGKAGIPPFKADRDEVFIRPATYRALPDDLKSYFQACEKPGFLIFGR